MEMESEHLVTGVQQAAAGQELKVKRKRRSEKTRRLRTCTWAATARLV